MFLATVMPRGVRADELAGARDLHGLAAVRTNLLSTPAAAHDVARAGEAHVAGRVDEAQHRLAGALRPRASPGALLCRNESAAPLIAGTRQPSGSIRDPVQDVA
jgi:hypothetical protein